MLKNEQKYYYIRIDDILDQIDIINRDDSGYWGSLNKQGAKDYFDTSGLIEIEYNQFVTETHNFYSYKMSSISDKGWIRLQNWCRENKYLLNNFL